MFTHLPSSSHIHFWSLLADLMDLVGKVEILKPSNVNVVFKKNSGKCKWVFPSPDCSGKDLNSGNFFSSLFFDISH